jgi:hypothetical protein
MNGPKAVPLLERQNLIGEGSDQDFQIFINGPFGPESGSAPGIGTVAMFLSA